MLLADLHVDGISLSAIEVQVWTSTYGASYANQVAKLFAEGRGPASDTVNEYICEEAASIADNAVEFLRGLKCSQ